MLTHLDRSISSPSRLASIYFIGFCLRLSAVVFLMLGIVCASEAKAASALPTGHSIAYQQSAPSFVGIQPVIIQGQPSQQMPQQQAAPSFASEPVVEGFADKVPLTIALQQILPQGFGYTLGDGVDPGLLVSWRGGRPWEQVLQDMLGSAGLMANNNGRGIVVGYAGNAPTVISAAPQVAPVQQPVPQYQPQVTYQTAPQAAPQVAPAPQPVYVPQVTVQPQQQPVALLPEQQPPMPQYQAPQGAAVQIQPPQYQPQYQVQNTPAQAYVPQPVPQVQEQQPMPMPQEPTVQVQQPAPPTQAGLPTPQALQIENPLIFTPQNWEAKPGQSLRSLLQEWCGRVGAELNWSAEYDYPIMASMNMTGTFEEAVRTVLSGFNNANPTPRGRLHYNPAAGQAILIVEATGNNYGE